MNLSQRARAVRHLVMHRLTGRRIPLYVGIKVTDRCNSNCVYCKASKAPGEMDTREITGLLRELRRLGTVAVSFTGGEPLVRKDIGTILRTAHGLGLYVSLNTTGALLPEKRWLLQYVDNVELSLDGPKEVHDLQRGKGSFESTMKAAELTRGKVGFNFTVTRNNLEHAEFAIRLARQFGAKVNFSPLIPAKGKDLKCIMPDNVDAKRFFLSLRGAANSRRNCEYMATYPEGRAIRCFAGRLFCRINHEGRVFPCPMVEQGRDRIQDKGFLYAFERIPSYECTSCWCNSVLEFNMICNGDIRSMIRSLRTI